MTLDLNEIKMRPAVATDLKRLVGIEHSVNSDYVWQVDVRKLEGQISTTLREVRLPRTVQVTYPRDVFSLTDQWNRGALTLVATLDGISLGYIRIFEQPTAASVWVMDLVVSTEARRSGVASTMLQAVQAWAKKRENRQIFFEMPSKNQPAIRLAEKLGFEFSGYNDHYYATQDVALFFGKILR